MQAWNAKNYLKFEKERTQPVFDLLNRVHSGCRAQVLDLGCGPGNSTKALKDRYPHAKILGVDNSPEMIAKASAEYPEIDFCIFDANLPLGGLGKKFDLVFSNACLQWLPDHARLMPDIFSNVTGGGVLAIQVPQQDKAPFYKLLKDMSGLDKYAPYFKDVFRGHVLEVGQYYDIFSKLTPSFDIWETAYCHTVASVDSVLEWYGATGLRPFLAALPKDAREPFKADLLSRLKSVFHPQADGKILLRMNRLFIAAQKK